MDIEKNKRINNLVPKIIDQSRKYIKRFRNNVKITNMITEFELRSSNKFDNYVKQSINRYKNLKVGKDLNFVLNNTKKLRIKEANDILSDKFYSDGNMKEIRNYKTSIKLYKALKKSFDKVRQENPINNVIKTSSHFSNKIEKNEKIKISQKEKLDQDKKAIDNVFIKDKKKFSLMFKDYKENLKKLEKLKETDNEQYIVLRKKLSIALPNINLLNYVKCAETKIIEPNEEEIQRNILRSIIPYCKSNYFTNNNKIIKKSKSTLDDEIRGNSNTNEALIKTAYKQFNDFGIFDKKRKKLENVLGIDSIPDFKLYESIIKSKFNEIKANRYKFNSYNKSSRANMIPNYFEEVNHKIDNNICFLTKIESSIFNVNNTKTRSHKNLEDFN